MSEEMNPNENVRINLVFHFSIKIDFDMACVTKRKEVYVFENWILYGLEKIENIQKI